MSKSNHLKVTLIMAMAVNGKVAQNEFQNSFEWNSKEDQRQFLKRIKRIGTVVMGSRSFEANNQYPYAGVYTIVLTGDPTRFKKQSNVEFMSGDVDDVCQNLQARGLKRIALLGGPTVNSQFFNRDLVDEIFLTIEPVMLLKGINLIHDLKSDIRLGLASMNRIDKSDTILLHYTILKT